MENWGLVTYRESMLLAGANATLSTKKGVALTVAHELSHQWFGDLVTMEWWDDLWLNESFASVMEYYAVDAIYPEFQIFEGFYTGEARMALERDACSDVQSVHQEVKEPAEIATLFDSAIVYAKGARLMLMLIRLMGWEQFCKGVADYFDKYKYQKRVKATQNTI
jgi:aminopeptidase N